MWGKVKLTTMKYLIVLQALSSTQAHRVDLMIYVQIGLLERGKQGTLRAYSQWNGVDESTGEMKSQKRK